MVRTKEEAKKAEELRASMVPSTKQEEVEIEDMPLVTMGDYVRYNALARAMNKKLRVCRYPIKPPPIELHPTERVQFGRVDQPNNACPVYLSNDMIEFKQTLYPGKIYDLPRIVVDYLAQKGTPEWIRVTNPDGSEESRFSHNKPRFALRTIYKD